MRANHLPLRFVGLIATASVFATGLCTTPALAGTTVSATASNGASASPALAASRSASGPGTRSLVDGTRMPVDPNRTSRTTRTVTTNGVPWSPTGGPRASGSATPGQLVQITTPAAPANAASPAAAKSSTRVDFGVTPHGGGGASAGASAGAPVPSATTTAIAPTDPSPAYSAAGSPVATQPSARPGPAPQAQATPLAVAPSAVAPPLSPTGAPTQRSVPRPPATQPVAAAPPTSVPPATQPVATPPSPTAPVATGPVATAREPVAAGPVATESLESESASLTPGIRAPGLHQLQILVKRWLRGENEQATRPLTTPDSSRSRAPRHPSRGLVNGPLEPALGSPSVLAGEVDLGRVLASVAAAPRRPEQSLKPRSVARPRAAAPPPSLQALSPAPTVQTRLPVGGAAGASGGGVGSAAPSVVAEFGALALGLATILLVRFSLDRVMWRSTLLESGLERPG